jgi:hypothetical protein
MTVMGAPDGAKTLLMLLLLLSWGASVEPMPDGSLSADSSRPTMSSLFLIVFLLLLLVLFLPLCQSICP